MKMRTTAEQNIIILKDPEAVLLAMEITPLHGPRSRRTLVER